MSAPTARYDAGELEAERHFLSIASHELRSPLASIIGGLDLVLDQWTNLDEDEVRAILTKLQDRCHRLNRLVDDLLSTSRLQEGAYQPRFEVLDLAEAVQRSMAEVAHALGDVPLDCPRGLRATADRDFLLQILINLLTNAARYGEPPVGVTCRRVAATAEIAVHDCGPGVPEDQIHALFQRFAQLGRRRKDGTGLGLSIVRGLANAQGGAVRYEPNRPRGARFVVILPAAD